MSTSLPRTARLLGIACAIGFAIGFGTRCAHVEPPSGGPVDATPPAVIAVYPAPGALNVPRDARAVFQFDEWIDRFAARNQVMVSPPYRTRTHIEVDGDRLLVLPPGGEGLRANTTHVLTVLSTLKDLHSNALGREFTLRFSTGPQLDSAGLSGTLSADSRRGRLMAALYPVTADSTSKPWSDLPAWLAAADSAGRFRAEGSPVGDYALFAFEDVNGNFAFDAGFENAATGATRIPLRPRGPDQSLRLTALDTLPLRIAQASFESDLAPEDSAKPTPDYLPGTVAIQFTRNAHPLRAAEAARYRILPDSGAPLPVRSVSWSPTRNVWVLETPPLRANKPYRVELRGRPDFPGRPGLTVEASGGLDTSVIFLAERAPKPAEWSLLAIRAAGTTGPSGLPQIATALIPGSRLFFTSNLPLTETRWSLLEKNLSARFSGDTVPVAARVRRADNLTFALDLSRPLRAGGGLELKLLGSPGDSTPPKGLFGGRTTDSSQSGSVRFSAATANGKTFWLRSHSELAPNEFTLLRAGDSLKAVALPSGRYRLFAFQDRDGDGVWDAGALRPWIAQEPFESLLDSVTVMPGEGVDVTGRLKK